MDLTQLQELGYSIRQICNQIRNMDIPKIARQSGLDRAPQYLERKSEILRGPTEHRNMAV